MKNSTSKLHRPQNVFDQRAIKIAWSWNQKQTISLKGGRFNDMVSRWWISIVLAASFPVNIWKLLQHHGVRFHMFTRKLAARARDIQYRHTISINRPPSDSVCFWLHDLAILMTRWSNPFWRRCNIGVGFFMMFSCWLPVAMQWTKKPRVHLQHGISTTIHLSHNTYLQQPFTNISSKNEPLGIPIPCHRNFTAHRLLDPNAKSTLHADDTHLRKPMTPYLRTQSHYHSERHRSGEVRNGFLSNNFEQPWVFEELSYFPK